MSFPTTVKAPNAAASKRTMVAPTGVEKTMDINMPARAHTTDTMAEQMVTPLNVRHTRMAESAGKTTSADKSKAPTRLIPITITNDTIMASAVLYLLVWMPVARANDSSNVMEKILLYSRTKAPTTTTDMARQHRTSNRLKVRIDVEPKRELHTSPDTLEEVLNTFIRR